MGLRRDPAPSATPATTPPARRYVVFSLAGVEYAIVAAHVKHSLPATAGLGTEVRCQDRAYPLLDLRALFRLAPSAEPTRFVLVVEGTERSAGLVVDALVRLAPLEEAAIQPLSPVFRGREREWFAGLARLGSRIVPVIRVDGILNEAAAPTVPALPRAAVAGPAAG